MPLDTSLLQKYPYLNLTEEELRGMMDCDSVINAHHDRIKQFEDSIREYESRIANHTSVIDRLTDERGRLEALIKANETEIREARGRLNSDRYSLKMAQKRIEERGVAIDKRQKVIFNFEVRRRLAQMGRDLKLNVGQRAARNMGEAVVPREQVKNKFPSGMVG